MKIILDVEDEKVPFMIEMLQHFQFVKVEPLGKKEEILEVNQVGAG